MASLTSQGLWILFAKIFAFGLNVTLPLLVVRYMSQEQVGVYRQVFLVIANALTILPLGFSVSAYYFLNREPENRSSAILHIVLFNFVMGGLAFLTLFLFPELLGGLFQNPTLSLLAPQIGFVIWLWIFSSFLEIAILANQEARLAAIFIIVSQLTKTILMVGAVIAIATVEAFIYAAAVQGVLQICALLVYLVRRFPHFWASFNWGFFRRQIAYALPFGLATLLYAVQSDIHNYFVSYGFGPAQFAIYSIGCFQLPLIAILYESVGAVVIPRMSQLQAEGKRREMLLMTVYGTQKLSFFYFPLFVFLMIMAGEFITTLFTSDYAASVPVFRINLLTLPIFCLMVDPIARAYAEVGRFLLKLRIVLLVLLTATFWYLIGSISLLHIISIVVVAFLIEKIASTWKSLQMLGVRREDIYLLNNIVKTSSAAAAGGIVLLAFYLSTKDYLLKLCVDLSRSAFVLIGFDAAPEFVGGCMFLGTCLLLYSLVYLLFAHKLGVPESNEAVSAIARILRVFTKSQQPGKFDSVDTVAPTSFE